MPAKKGKSARFQVDQVGDKEEDVVLDENMLTTKSETVHFTQYHKSLHHYLTREVLPLENNYRNLSSFGNQSFRGKLRPTMEELREEDVKRLYDLPAKDAENPGGQKKKGKVVKLGWINGVYVSKGSICCPLKLIFM
jgi:hypothetical protein